MSNIRIGNNSLTYQQVTGELPEHLITGRETKNGIKSILADWAIDEIWINKVLALARSQDAVSFDIFDTALTRDIDSPFDIFARVEKYLAAENDNFIGFAIAREQAEENARLYAGQKGFSEVTYDEIYAQLPSVIKLSETELALAKERELAEEKYALCAVPDILLCTEKLAQAGIPYLFVSDMYLPPEFLGAILAREGYKNWQSIIVSSEFRRTKAKGDIWRIAALRDKKLLHIGDNKKSDVKKPPRQTGRRVNTLLYKRAQSILRWGGELDPAVLPFSEAHRAATLALRSDAHYSSLSEAEQDAKELYCLGQSFGAVILGAFIFWLLRRAKQNNIKKLFFCARDGWLMLKAWEILTKNTDCNIEAAYLYVSRRVLMYARGAVECTAQEISPFMLDFLTQSSHGMTNADIITQLKDLSPEIAARAAALLGKPNAPFHRKKRYNELCALLKNESEELYKGFCRWHEKVQAYLTQEGVPQAENAAIVDMGWQGTLQNALTKIGRSVNPQFSIMGFYYGLWPQSSVNRYQGGAMEASFFHEFISVEKGRCLQQFIGTLENLHTAPEGSCIDFFCKASKWYPMIPQTEMGEFNGILLEPFVKGCLAALEKLRNTDEIIGGAKRQDLTPQSGLSAILRLTLSPSAQEISALGKIRHSSHWSHSNSLSISHLPQPWIKKRALHTFGAVEWGTALWAEWRSKASSRHKKQILREIQEREFAYLTAREKRLFSLDKNQGL